MSRCVAMLVVAVSFLCAERFAAAEPEAGKFYRIRNVNSKKMLALDDKGADGAQIVQRAPGKNERQHWSFEAVGKHYRIINRKSGQRLNVKSTDEGSPIIASDDGKNAQWSLEAKGDKYVIRSRHSGMVVDVAEESKERKAPVIQFPFHEGRNQIFELEAVTE
jgi:hypothetical protein